MATAEDRLATLLQSVLADGAHGLTLRSGQLPIVYSDKESTGPAEGAAPSADEVSGLLRQLIDSRQMREMRDGGTITFMHTLESGVQLLGRARQEGAEIHLELRRMIGQQIDPPNPRLRSGR